MARTRIAVLGAGKLGETLIRGLLQAELVRATQHVIHHEVIQVIAIEVNKINSHRSIRSAAKRFARDQLKMAPAIEQDLRLRH